MSVWQNMHEPILWSSESSLNSILPISVTWEGIKMLSIFVFENACEPILRSSESFVKVTVFSLKHDSKALLWISLTWDGIVISVIWHPMQENAPIF